MKVEDIERVVAHEETLTTEISLLETKQCDNIGNTLRGNPRELLLRVSAGRVVNEVILPERLIIDFCKSVLDVGEIG